MDRRDKSLALSLLHFSPITYKLLQRLFKLPSVRTLSKAMQGISIYPGFDENIIQALCKNVKSMTSQCKLCALVIDEMTIK